MAVTVLIVIVLGAVFLMDKLSASKERVALTDYYKVSDSEAMIILDDMVYEKNALWVEGRPYFDMDTVVSLFNHRFYWDEEEKLMVYTSPTEIMQYQPDETNFLVNGEPISSEFPIVKLLKDTKYIAVEYLAQYSDFKYEVFKEPNRILVQYKWGDYLYSDVVENTVLRVGNTKKEDIVADLNVGDRLLYIDAGGEQANGFVKVMTESGIRGYVQSKDITESYYDTTKSDFVAPEYTSLRKETPIYLGWQLFYTTDSVPHLNSAVSNAEPLTTVAPCWFYLNSSTEGTMLSYANSAYVDRAHELELEVWATFKNDDIEGVFSCSADTFTLLQSTKGRGKLIDEMLAATKELKLDGINIDFEMLTKETGPHFIQFLRELSVICRNNGIILSVDNYVPASYNAFYDLKEQGTIVDYVVIMSYDEHYSGSEVAGSVASIGFVRDAVINTLDLVPAKKVIMGVPFYSRLWKEYEEGGKVKVKVEANPNMETAEATLQNEGVTPIWDEATGQYYGEYKKEDAKYRIWLENENSIEVKVSLMQEAGVAGVAAWKLGDEKVGIWEVIKSTMEK